MARVCEADHHWLRRVGRRRRDHLPWRDDHFRVFARPHNVNRPEDRPLSDMQRTMFERVATPTMERLGYAERDEYAVNY